MKHLALFNGIGGFQLAAHWMGWENVAHVEIDDWCNRVVAKHFPNSICHTDIKKFDGTQYANTIDILTGGFPCQPFSVAGKKLAEKDSRYLWPEMLRVINEIKPKFIVGENVLGIVNLALDKVHSQMAEIGYSTETYIIPACAVDAPHRRDRIWIISYPNSSNAAREKGASFTDNNFTERETTENIKQWDKWFNELESRNVVQRYDTYSGAMRILDGIPNRMDRLKGLGNAIVPQVAYEIFRAIEKRH